MGIYSSPYLSCQGSSRLKIQMLGDQLKENNPFGWPSIMINLSGDVKYDPTRVWISKRKANGQLVSNLHQYVDGGRITAEIECEAWSCSCHVGKQSSYHGVQDALRK